MRIVVVGSGGRLGGALMRVLEGRHEMTGLDRKALDLADSRSVQAVLGALEFDALLTPAALTSVDYCEEHPEQAMEVNAIAPETMARIALAKGARMIHFSTDYVFDGSDPRPRVEDDPVAPLGAYGCSKAAGEEAVLGVSPAFTVARVSWVFGPERPSFLDQIIQRAMADSAAQAVADKTSTPSFADDICEMVGLLLARPEVSGLLNLCNSGACTWQEYGQVGLDAAAAAGLVLKTRTLGGISLADIGFIAPRPQYTAMSTDKFAALFGQVPRAWQEAVRDYVSCYANRIGSVVE